MPIRLRALLPLLIGPLLLAGCIAPPPRPADAPKADGALAAAAVEAEQLSRNQQEAIRDTGKLSAPPPSRDAEGTLAKEASRLSEQQRELHRGLERRGPKTVQPAPVMPEYNPLDDIMLSLEMDGADARNVLLALAKQTHMNLLLHPDIVADPPLLSISFRNVPASTVFREILRIADLYGRVENNVMRVDPYQEAVFTLDFLETNFASSVNVGGNVLGGGGGGTGGGAGNQLAGNFSISGQGPKSTNPYDQLEATLNGLIGDKGSFQLNRLSGTLYVKAKPSAVRTVGELIERYKKVVARQILIEARIMEVRLTDQFSAGVDWAMLRNNIVTTVGIGQTVSNIALTAGSAPSITFNSTTPQVAEGGLGATWSNGKTLAIIDLLKQFGDVQVISNPSIRAKHGQPALISVGQTNNYIRETKVTTTTNTVGGQTQTDVTVDSVFNGLVIGVTPFVTDDRRITLTIHPIQSDVDSSSLQLVDVGGGASVSLPKVDLKEISTILELHDNDTVMLGGLIDKRKNGSRDGVPVLSEVPLVGRLFTSNSEQQSLRELVIMLKVSVL